MRRVIVKAVVALLTFIVGVGSTYFIWLTLARRDAPTPVVPWADPALSALGLPGERNPTRPVQEDWERLTNAEFCFFGSNMYSPLLEERKHIRSETGAPFNPYGWLSSLIKDESAGVEFLIKQIPDRSQAKAHVDPLGRATKGEMAVYCLQHIVKINWDELKEDYKVRLDRALEQDPGQSQAVLYTIINNRKGAQEMMDLWARYYQERRRPLPPTD